MSNQNSNPIIRGYLKLLSLFICCLVLSGFSTTLKIGWITAPKFDQNPKDFDRVIQKIKDEKVTLLIVGGNIGNSLCTKKWIEKLQKEAKCDIYFILGHHDFYKGSISSFRKEITHFANQNEALYYLSAHGMIDLTKKTALVGMDGLADTYIGSVSWIKSKLNQITEFVSLEGKQAMELLQKNGKQEAQELKGKLLNAFKTHQGVILVLETLPFVIDSKQEPFFQCQEIGKMLMEMMGENPKKDLFVLCSHPSKSQEFFPLENLRVKVHSQRPKPAVLFIE